MSINKLIKLIFTLSTAMAKAGGESNEMNQYVTVGTSSRKT